jgi:hypothetical protein
LRQQLADIRGKPKSCYFDCCSDAQHKHIFDRLRLGDGSITTYDGLSAAHYHLEFVELLRTQGGNAAFNMTFNVRICGKQFEASNTGRVYGIAVTSMNARITAGHRCLEFEIGVVRSVIALSNELAKLGRGITVLVTRSPAPFSEPPAKSSTETGLYKQ